MWLGYQAIYARRQNYGSVGADKLGRGFNQAGSYFVEGAIEKGPQIVAQAQVFQNTAIDQGHRRSARLRPKLHLA